MDLVNLKLTKQELAKIQLDRAIKLLFDENDYISAITLAGAAEEILGKLLNERGDTSALEDIVSMSMAHAQLCGDDVDKRGVVTVANWYRDRCKHLSDNQPVYFSANFEAASLIDRAASNYFRLTGTETKEMERFRDARIFSRSWSESS